MLTLVHAPRSRSSRFLWLLEEIGQPYDIQYVSIRRSDGSGALDPANPHPHGKVPDLKDGGATMVFEQTAIALYLADRFPDARLGPAIGDPARGEFLTMLAYYSGVLEPAFIEIHEGCRAARDSRLGRFGRGDDFHQRPHCCTALYRGRNVHCGGRALRQDLPPRRARFAPDLSCSAWAWTRQSRSAA